MGVHLEGIIAAACLPLLLTMVLFLGPLIQLVMDYPWDLFKGMKTFLGEPGPLSGWLRRDCRSLCHCKDSGFGLEHS
ncbi:hypothetical protein scyTo_0023718 [Scyliorhinus torazame]|uniref:Uncharacterized protein n=1 Tax=Scyliorhinus torazame TaxID=75743 RepID=A0A401QCF6_SCYTO|nr:hypothetical protein [Scyliorhinus torazame]